MFTFTETISCECSIGGGGKRKKAGFGVTAAIRKFVNQISTNLRVLAKSPLQHPDAKMAARRNPSQLFAEILHGGPEVHEIVLRVVVIRPVARVLQLVAWSNDASRSAIIPPGLEAAPAQGAAAVAAAAVAAAAEAEARLILAALTVEERAHLLDAALERVRLGKAYCLPTSFVVARGGRVVGRVCVFRVFTFDAVAGAATAQPAHPNIAASAALGAAWGLDDITVDADAREPWAQCLGTLAVHGDISAHVPGGFLQFLFAMAANDDASDASDAFSQDSSSSSAAEQEEDEDEDEDEEEEDEAPAPASLAALEPHTAALVARGALAEGRQCALAFSELAGARIFFVPPCGHVVRAAQQPACASDGAALERGGTRVGTGAGTEAGTEAGAGVGGTSAEWDARIPTLRECPTCRANVRQTWVRVELPARQRETETKRVRASKAL